MAVTGRKPKPDGQKRNRVKPVYDWVEVLDMPYDGPRPEPGRLPKVTQEWWEVVTRMPHCVLWEDSDWRWVIDTARVHAQAFGPKSKTGLLPVYVTMTKQLGITADQRRDLRIRYVDSNDNEDEEEAGVTSLADYRAALV